MTEPELCKLERANVAIDRAYRIVRPYIVINPGRKKTGLLTAFPALECMIRHKPNRTSTLENTRNSCPASTDKSALGYDDPLPSFRANGSREGAPDDRFREAIDRAA
jgi:hypothetical protein